MNQQPSITITPDDDASVVEFGGDREPRSTRRAALARLLSGQRRDPRIVPAVAALGVLAVFASLVDEWQTTSMRNDRQAGIPTEFALEFTADLGDLRVWGVGYLFGVFAVITCLALVLSGTPAVRQPARVAGLGLCGSLAGLLLAIAVKIGSTSLLIDARFETEQPQLSYGRGALLAFLGVGGLGLALYLAGRLAPDGPQATAAVVDAAATGVPPLAGAHTGPGGPAHLASGPGHHGYWRRPPATTDDPAPDGPPDLTVAPAPPFTPLAERRPAQW